MATVSNPTALYVVDQWVVMQPGATRNNGLAEREGFEPPVPLRVLRISSAARSTTLPPLQAFDLL